MQETHRRPGFNPWVGKIPWEEEMAAHSSILAWKIPYMEEPGGLQSMGLQRVQHNWAGSPATHIVWLRTGNMTSLHKAVNAGLWLGICWQSNHWALQGNAVNQASETMFPSKVFWLWQLYFSTSESEIVQSCLTLCDPMDCSLRGSSVHGVFQARILEWGAISFSRGSSQPRDRTLVSRIVCRRVTVWAARNSPSLINKVAR